MVKGQGEGWLLPRRPVATAAAVAVAMMVVCDDDMVNVRLAWRWDERKVNRGGGEELKDRSEDCCRQQNQFGCGSGRQKLPDGIV